MTEPTIQLKTCARCGVPKPRAGEFYKHRARSDGLDSQCKSCHRIRDQRYSASQLPLADLKLAQEDTERFWSKVDVRGPDECWPWKAGKDKDGYGHFSVRGIDLRASRVAWWIQTGNWPPVVRHKVCDSPSCCNFSHLLAGTPAENIHDMLEKGRAVVGTRLHGGLNPGAALTDAQAEAVRLRYNKGGVSQKLLADEHHVSEIAIWRIVTGKRYKTAVM